jgi:energy-coupling factor transporter ATP-binding protein EcfA2
MIRFDDFTFTYSGQDNPALKGVTLEIDESEFVLVTGPSGGGKSTLCRCLNGLIPHFHGGTLRGRVSVAGMDITRHQPREFATAVGMVFQDPENQLVGADVERDIAFGLENLGLDPVVIAERVDESLAALGITALRRRPVASLSGGEKQKAALAAALAVHPRVLVLDEPTSELDPESAREFMELLTGLHESHDITVVLVEHRLERVVEFCRRMVVLDGGRIVADGSSEAVLESLLNMTHSVGVPVMAELAHAFRISGQWRGALPTSVGEAQSSFGILLPDEVPEHRWERKHTPGETLIAVDDLWFSYDKQPPVLQGITTQVHAGELLAVMGRNGSGKTTLARHLNGLLKPSRGTVRVRGVDTAGVSVPELARTVGLVFQNPNDHLFADTVEEEMVFTLKQLQIYPEEARKRVEETLTLFGLNEYRAHYPRSLSGGERQRVALASVVAARPGVLVLDEPTRGLEQALKDALMEFLVGYCAAGNAVVLITHDVEMVARHADRVLLLEKGRVAADGPRRKVLAHSETFQPDVTRFARPYFEGTDIEAFLTLEDVAEAYT